MLKIHMARDSIFFILSFSGCPENRGPLKMTLSHGHHSVPAPSVPFQAKHVIHRPTSPSLPSNGSKAQFRWGSVFAYGLMTTLALLALAPLLSALR